MQYVREVDPMKLLTVSFMLTEEKVTHIRECFNIPDMIGNLGGVIEVFVIIFGIIIFPLSEHKFTLKAVQLLFFARTRDPNFFMKKKDPNIPNNKENIDVTKESMNEIET
jgi:hypothetical protein